MNLIGIKIFMKIIIFSRVMLKGVLREIVNKLFLKSFYTTFIENWKNYENINYFSFSYIKTFLKWFTKIIPRAFINFSLFK